MTIIQKNNRVIKTVNQKEDRVFLQTPTKLFDFKQYTPQEIDELVLFMRSTMVAQRGVGLSANQMGFSFQLFVCQLPSKNQKGYQGKCHVLFNPVITTYSKKTSQDTEGCLSVPTIFGDVERAEKITVQAYTKRGVQTLIKAEGLLARIMQHEIDHLNGILFIEKAKNLHSLSIQNDPHTIS